MTDELMKVEQTPTPMEFIEYALRSGLDKEMLQALISMKHAEDDRNAKLLFDEALANVQAEIGRIAPDSRGEKNNYASYSALDRVIRPIYSKYGFSLSFTAEGFSESELLMVCDVSHKAGHTRRYTLPVPRDGKGPKGNDALSKTHATGAATLYGRRYLLAMIFNLAIGIDPDNTGSINEAKGQLDVCSTREELDNVFKPLFAQARSLRDKELISSLVTHYDKRKAELQ